METYKNNFLSKEYNSIIDVLTKSAEKIYERMEKENKDVLLTEAWSSNSKMFLRDALYGYAYDSSGVDIYERAIKGFGIAENSLFVCLDLECVLYTESILKENFYDMTNEWHLIYDNKTKELRHSEGINVILTMMGTIECLYQYFND